MTKKIPQFLPYQPLLLRILHGLTGLSLIAAIVSAYWTYDTYDRRWGGFLPIYQDIEGIHGTFGLWTLLIFPALAIYAFHRGQRRLIQTDSFGKLAHVGRPIWWYTLSRIANTLTLVALTFALFSGKMMDDTWLPKGELTHFWYSVHLIAWVVMVCAIGLHLLMNAKVGGAPLLLSMLNWQCRDKDRPTLWLAHVSQWWSGVRQGSWASWFQPLTATTVLEIAIVVSIVAAWIIPVFK